MAQFQGTIQEFTKFIGPYARIKVAYLAAKYKKQLGQCEDCGDASVMLDAAHIYGMERPVIISRILSEFIENNIITIDLNAFEERYIAAHTPIEKSIRVLCKKCHRLYDNARKVKELIPEGMETDDTSALEKLQQGESHVIESLLGDKIMTKAKALAIGKEKSLAFLDNSNTIFSNINSAQDVWWLQPNNKKFQKVLFIVLNDDERRLLLFFRLPAGTINEPERYFRQRNDVYRRNCSDIYIPLSGWKFIDRNGFDFSQYLIKTVSY